MHGVLQELELQKEKCLDEPYGDVVKYERKMNFSRGCRTRYFWILSNGTESLNFLSLG